jgi:hypothetical protein
MVGYAARTRFTRQESPPEIVHYIDATAEHAHAQDKSAERS